ncbi:hypothetical protein ACOACQ_02630 [Nocardioides sp. CPCC 206347]|uniref:hypothetical protein n=1 Tax=Nocardioides sp. CPCC 206347 TaxID=3406463 RepID=UPI003B43CE3B
MQSSDGSRRFSRESLATCLTGLLLTGLVARLAVHDGDSYYSGSEFQKWLEVVGTVTACFLTAGLFLIRRPVGRGILLGTVSAAVLLACAVFAEAYISVTTGPY